MFGWINFVIRDLLIKKYDKWVEVCALMNIPITSTFPRSKHFSDASTISLVESASRVLDIDVQDMLETIGEYFLAFVREDGYDEMLRCLGDTLQEWLSNVNHLHIHLELTLHLENSANKYHAPLFWSTETQTDSDGDIILYYQSVRGPVLASMVVGMVREVARSFFSTAVTFERILTQGVDGSKFTSWKVHGDKPLHSAMMGPPSRPMSIRNMSAAAKHLENLCPMRLKLSTSLSTVDETENETSLDIYDDVDEADYYDSDDMKAHQSFSARARASIASLQRSLSAPNMLPIAAVESPALNNRQMKELFPFCIIFDQNMSIIDCGESIVEILGKSPVGSRLHEFLDIQVPAGEIDTWANFLQIYSVANVFSSEVKSEHGVSLRLKGIVTLSDSCCTGYYMCHADVRSLGEMKQSRLCPRHLATQVCRMEYLLQTDLLQSELRASVKLNKAQKDLEQQKAYAAKLSRDSALHATKLATQSLENKRTFVRYIGHEIRTPLTVVKLGLKLALADARHLGANEDFVNNISDCEDSVDVAVAILNDLLAYEKLDSGILEMFKEIIIVVPFIVRSLRPFEKQAEVKQITLTIENNFLDDMSNFAIYADKSKMSQVIRNFISNALKFTPNGGKVKVRISLLNPKQQRQRALSETSVKGPIAGHRFEDISSTIKAGSSPNSREKRFMKCTSADSLLSMSSAKPATSYKTIQSVMDNADFHLLEHVLVIEFIDSGKGISEENQKKLFRDKVQFNPHVTQEGGGSGLGLWISNGIIKLHNGYVEVKTNPDNQPGVTFSLQMPIYRKMSHSASQLPSAPLKDLGESVELPSLKSASLSDISLAKALRTMAVMESDDTIEDDTDDDVVITTSSVSDIQMDFDDSADQKLFLHALVCDKEKRLALQSSAPAQTLRIDTNFVDQPSDVKVLDQSQYHASGAGHRSVEQGPLYGCRVLLVDDSKLILRVTSKTLIALGVACDSVLDGKEAIEQIRKCCWRSARSVSDAEAEGDVSGGGGKGRARGFSVGEDGDKHFWDVNYYDLVMLDKQMPVMDGLQTCRELRKMGYSGTIIGVTGSCMPSEVEEFRRVGINEVFSKPLDINQLECYYSRIRAEKSRKYSH